MRGIQLPATQLMAELNPGCSSSFDGLPIAGITHLRRFCDEGLRAGWWHLACSFRLTSPPSLTQGFVRDQGWMEIDVSQAASLQYLMAYSHRCCLQFPPCSTTTSRWIGAIT